jgi:hypothetical protein
MFPGSTIFSLTMPSKGAAIVVKDSVVLAWSLTAGRSRLPTRPASPART